MPAPHASNQPAQSSAPVSTRTATSGVILAILVLNTLGILLLFVVLDWDVRQISAELGLVSDVVKAERLAERETTKREIANEVARVLGEEQPTTDWRTYASEEYSFRYPSTYIVENPTEGFPVLTIRGSQGRIEIFQFSDFPENDRPFGFEGEVTQEEVDGYVPKEHREVAMSPNGILSGGTYNMWLFYSQSDEQTKQELQRIADSLR